MTNPFEDAVHFLLRHHEKHAIDPTSQKQAAALLAKLNNAPAAEPPAPVSATPLSPALPIPAAKAPVK